jgi:uncharacterized protein YjbJ (UPF0337 family)
MDPVQHSPASHFSYPAALASPNPHIDLLPTDADPAETANRGSAVTPGGLNHTSVEIKDVFSGERRQHGSSWNGAEPPLNFQLQSATLVQVKRISTHTRCCMDKEHVKGAAETGGGKIEEAAGHMIGNKKLENKGKVDQVKGAVHSAVGDVKDAANATFNDQRNYPARH